MASDRVTFSRVNTTYVIPRDHPAPFELRRSGEEAMREHLQGALSEVFARMLPRGGESIWLVRELSVDFPFTADRATAPVLAMTWAREIAEKLTLTIRKGEGVTRFPSRAAFVAQYVSDVASGRDKGCWYYDEFESLQALPAGAAIREAFLREPDNARAVLFALAESGRLVSVLAATSEESASAIYEAAFSERATEAASPRLFEIVTALAADLIAGGNARPIATPKNAIRLMTGLQHHCGGRLSAGEARSHVDALLALASALERAESPWSVVEALMSDSAIIEYSIGEAHRALLTSLSAVRPDVVTCAASTLMPAARTTDAAGAVPSAFAGLALLLPSLQELEPFAGDNTACAAMRAVIAMKCAGGVRALQLLGDPILQLFTGDEHRVTAEVIASLTAGDAFAIATERSVSDADRQSMQLRGIAVDDTVDRFATVAAHEVMAAFASRLFGFAGSSLSYLYDNFLAGDGRIALRDAAIIVDLPPVPLEVVLRLAGFHEKTFDLPWWPQRTVSLRLGAAQ